MLTITTDQITLVQRLLPSEAIALTADGGYGWDIDYIRQLMTENAYTPTQAVRYFWLQRVNETSEYLDTGGKALTAIHRQAKEMLDYWDNILVKYGADSSGPEIGVSALNFVPIERPSSYRAIENYYCVEDDYC